jgi:hypothetical protein
MDAGLEGYRSATNEYSRKLACATRLFDTNICATLALQQRSGFSEAVA